MANKPNDGPVEAFRQVTAAAMRAVAHEPELQVTFAPEPAAIRGNDVRLPVPSRELAREEVAIIRGEADAMSLRLRFHDEALHRKRAPGGAMARQIYNIVEQARCEARGARRMTGTAANLSAAIEERCRTQGFARVTEKESAPLVEVVGLLAREAFAGQAVPQSARKSAQVNGLHGRLPQRFGPAPPQNAPESQRPQSSTPPQPSEILPHSAPMPSQLTAVQDPDCPDF